MDNGTGAEKAEETIGGGGAQNLAVDIERMEGEMTTNQVDVLGMEVE